MRFAAAGAPTRQDPETGDESEQPEIDAAKKIIKHYSRAYNPELYPNPGGLAALLASRPLPCTRHRIPC